MRERMAGWRIPRVALLPLCVALTLAAYGLLFFTDWSNAYHGGGALRTVALDAAVVLAAFSCWEVFRTEKLTPVRAVAAAVGFPLALVAVLMLWYGLRRHFG
jgi:hypothetical protein